jgi:minimal PKS acyl carrier protein
MSTFTLADLKSALREAAGDDASVLEGDILDTSLVELGYDSLALLEVASIIQRSYGVPMPDDAFLQMATPRQAVESVNEILARAAA